MGTINELDWVEIFANSAINVVGNATLERTPETWLEGNMHEKTGLAAGTTAAQPPNNGTARPPAITASVAGRHPDGTVARVVIRCSNCGGRVCDLLFPGHKGRPLDVAAVIKAEVRCPACGETASRALAGPRRAAVVVSGAWRCVGGPWAGVGIACDRHLGRVDAARGRLMLPHRRCSGIELDLAEVIRALDLGAAPTMPDR